MKYLPYVLIWVIPFMVAYLLKSFVLMSFDAATWTVSNRESVVSSAFVISFILTGAKMLLEKWEEIR